MRFFNQIPASEAVDRGTNPSCVVDRNMVCKAKEGTVIGPKRNVVIVEKGEKIVCEYSSYDGDFIFRFTSIEALKSRPASQLIGGAWYEVAAILPFEDFKSKFEIIDEETEQILPFFEAIDKEVCSMRTCRDKLHEAEYNTETTSNLISGLFCLALSIAGFIFAFVDCQHREIPDSSMLIYAAAYAMIFVITGFGIIFGALILKDVVNSPIQLNKFSAKVKAAKKEYDTVSNNGELSIETFKKNMCWPQQMGQNGNQAGE